MSCHPLLQTPFRFAPLKLSGWPTLWEGQGEKPHRSLTSPSRILGWRWLRSTVKKIVFEFFLFQDLSLEEKKNRKKKQRVLNNLHAKEDESSKFLSDFNPSSDRKAKAKVTGRYSAAPTSSAKKNSIYDNKVTAESDNICDVQHGSYVDLKDNVLQGVLLHSGLDLCDCLEDSCPGCHFPCPKCK